MFGGFKDQVEEMKDFWVFDCNSLRWHQLEPSNVCARGGSKLVYDNECDQLFLLGRKPLDKSENMKVCFIFFNLNVVKNKFI